MSALPVSMMVMARGVVVLVAALVGLVAGLAPTIGLGLAFGVVYVVLVVENLAIGLTMFVGISFLEDIGGVGELSVARVAGGLLLIGWAGTLAARPEHARRLQRDHPGATAALIALGAWALLSAAWAEFPVAAFSGAQRWVLNLAMFAIVYTAIRKPNHVRWVLALYICGALFSAAVGLFTGAVGAGDADRLEGSGVNANELGLLLGVATVLALGFAACRDFAPVSRALALAAAGCGVVALLTTGSRGALVGLIVAACVAPFLVGKGRRLFTVAVITLAAAGAASYLVTVAPAQFERVTAADTTGSGRTDLWQVGWRMVEDKPIAGVGVDNYASSTIHYLLEPGGLTRSDHIVGQKQAHNVYLQVLAELGAVGLALFLFVIGFALVSLLRAARAFGREGDRTMDLLSRALLIALCGQLAALTFSTAVYSKQLWLMLALSIAIAAIARDQRRDRQVARL